MKQVININFQGQVVPIEVTAFDILKKYTDSLHRYFANEQGKEEIINDIESRFGELFQERLKKGSTCITDDDVQAIIASMGRPEDFDTNENADQQSAGNYGSHPLNDANQTGPKKLYRDENDKMVGGVCSGLANYFGIDTVIVRIIFVVLLFSGIGFLAYVIMWAVVPSSSINQIGGYRKKLYRDPDGKIIAGVCSGLAKYFGVKVWIPRILFLIPFLSFAFKWGHWGNFGFPDFLSFSFSPGSFFVYIILWLVLPEAITTSEKLELKGEKVDMNSIKNSVVEEMKGVRERAQKLSNEAAGIARERTAAMGADVSQFARRNRTSFGDVVGTFFKIIFYIIFGSIAIGLVFALFGLAIAAVGVFPLKNFVFNGAYQNAMAWGTLIFFIAVPVIGVITWIIRRLTRVKSRNKNLAFVFSGLWLIGWICFMLLAGSITSDFKRSNNPREEFVALTNPAVSRLEITADEPGRTYFRRRWNRVDLYEALDKDSIFVRNVVFKIEKASGDSFAMSITRMARGYSRDAADTTARNIAYSVNQKDSLLIIDKGIAITPEQKFRNQYVIVRLYVPVGKQVRIDESVGRWNDAHIGFYDEDDWDFDTKYTQNQWRPNTTYEMKEDGLYTLDGYKASEEDRRDEKNRRRTQIRINGDDVNIETTEDGSYRYDSEDETPVQKIKKDSLQMQKELRRQMVRDSLNKLKIKAEEELRKLNEVNEGSSASAGFSSIIVYNPLM